VGQLGQQRPTTRVDGRWLQATGRVRQPRRETGDVPDAVHQLPASAFLAPLPACGLRAVGAAGSETALVVVGHRGCDRCRRCRTGRLVPVLVVQHSAALLCHEAVQYEEALEAAQLRRGAEGRGRRGVEGGRGGLRGDAADGGDEAPVGLELLLLLDGLEVLAVLGGEALDVVAGAVVGLVGADGGEEDGDVAG
jgi:hypothetical protein